MISLSDHEWSMKLALEEANIAYNAGEVPVGAVVVDDLGKVIARASNLKEKTHNPMGHAEILALHAASQALGRWRLNGCTLIVTLEPCVMCLGAMIHARIDHLVFGAYDSKAGALSLGYAAHKDPRLNHNLAVTGGLSHYECSSLLSQFFRERRAGHKS
jgi:tRNA(adenine34) deaminase